MEFTERIITNIDKIDSLLKGAYVCRIAFNDGEYPRIVPMCFGHSLSGGELTLYFRCGEQSDILELVSSDNSASFEIDELHGITHSGEPFDFDTHYWKIFGYGAVEKITGVDKIMGFSQILKKYAEFPADQKLHEQTINSFAILKLTAERFFCREHG